MPIISERDKAIIQQQMSTLKQPVRLINFTQELECEYCRDTSQLMREVAQTSGSLRFEQYNFVTDKEMTEKYKIEQIPATVVMDDRDHGIKFYGIPSGYEFATILDTIKMVSSGQSGLAKETKDYLRTLTTPINLKVFVTPT